MPGDIMTDMPFALHPEGLYKAIEGYSGFGIPLYITETGIADHRDDRRALFINGYMREASGMMRAIADGHDVRGIYYWTLVDNFKWYNGYDMKFGLYSYKPGSGQEPRLKG
ncbi:hypothetical protein GPECTOR_2g1031 [Gonium pectorale]|uniref:Glycoside hydrolase family 1 protein n=1 Tax=Gonium pectorale TaxID=33097 RepID=A0A150H0H3_GONPE|nr:hypothetical protein GPECTOR_2g1031 [Gonium pectorale]|eukprot:KXZ55482.1 hypothetical protein GPECTOR_2g1031 [Gonium pectorale]